ncbi:MAG: matrixin family metalloprotease [Planctomycetes bacterium]|nr:matrixin family metalloprotease [Planctomycetota bacterium]
MQRTPLALTIVASLTVAGTAQTRQRRVTVHPTIAACFAPETPPEVVAEIERSFLGTIWRRPEAQTADRWPAPAGSGRELTYSFPPDGVFVPSSRGGELAGPNVLQQAMTNRFGSNQAARDWFRGVFALWSQATDLTFREVGDDGAAFPGSPGSGSRGDIRVVGRNVDGGGQVLGYARYPAGGGDIVFDTSDLGRSTASLVNVATHEIGHSVGLAHVCPAQGNKLMEPFATQLQGPQVDDARGGQELYGDRLEPNDSIGAAVSLNSLGAAPGAPLLLRPLGLQTVGDQDWFSIETCPLESVQILATPMGGSYQQGAQTSNCTNGTVVNAAAIEDLAIEVVYPSGLRAILNATSAGGSESTTVAGVSGRTAIRIFSAGSSGERVQLYQLSVNVTRPNSAVLYVDANASGNGTGTSWLNAFRFLEQALAAAAGGCGSTNEIWVADGTYRPMTPLPGQLPDLSVSFVVPDGARIYGGFAGNETARSQRDPVANQTILSGRYPHPIITTLWARHVVRMTGVGPGTVLDGFQVFGGSAPSGTGGGGGLRIQNGSPSIYGCTIHGHAVDQGGGCVSLGTGRPTFTECTLGGGEPPPRGTATQTGGALALENGAFVTRCQITGSVAARGAGIALLGGLLEVEDCTFLGNDASVSGAASGTGRGGGGLFAGGGSAVLRTCTFRDNYAIDGAGVLAIGIAVDLDRCRFEGNQAFGAGGAVHAQGGTCRLTGSVVFANRADWRGGATLDGGPHVVAGCTFARNDARLAPGGLGIGGSGAQLLGNVLWGNTVGLLTGGEAVQIQIGASAPAPDHCCIEGLTGALGGNANIASDPGFVDVLHGDLHLVPGSPCLDAGNASSLLPTSDIDGEPRLLSTQVDIGADEFGAAAAVLFGTSCGGDLAIQGLPRVGGSYTVQGWAPQGFGFLYLGFSRTTHAGIPLPYDLTSIGAVGCLIWISLDGVMASTAVSTSPMSLTDVAIPVPLSPALACLHYYHQWHFWLPGQPLASYGTSQAADLWLGF